MKKRYLIFCVFVLSISVLAQNKTAEMEIFEFVEKYQNAHIARDTAFIESVLAEDYSYTNPQGTAETRSAYLDYIKKEKAKPSYTINSSKTATCSSASSVILQWSPATGHLAPPR